MGPYYAEGMKGSALPLRIVYTLIATPVASIGGFYLGVLLFTRVVPTLEGIQGGDPGLVEFVLSLVVAGALGFTAFLFALTLPWRRLRRRKGRLLRIVFSAALVLVVSLIGAAESVPLSYIVGLVVWMSVVLTFTVIRYGVLDHSRSGEAGSRAIRTAEL